MLQLTMQIDERLLLLYIILITIIFVAGLVICLRLFYPSEKQIKKNIIKWTGYKSASVHYSLEFEVSFKNTLENLNMDYDKFNPLIVIQTDHFKIIREKIGFRYYLYRTWIETKDHPNLDEKFTTIKVNNSFYTTNSYSWHFVRVNSSYRKLRDMLISNGLIN
jgi:hypothetical protein